MLRKNHKKKPLPTQTSPRLPPEVPMPLPIRKIPSVDNLSLKPHENVKKEREPILKTPVFKKKYRKKKVHSLLREISSKKEIFILSEILKKPSLYDDPFIPLPENEHHKKPSPMHYTN